MKSRTSHGRWLASVGVAAGLAATLLALRPPQASTVSAIVRPAALTLCCPGRIDQGEGYSGESKFTVDFDRLPGQPGTSKLMRITWYGLSGTGDPHWAVVLGTGSLAPLACLSAEGGMHEAEISYIKPAGLQVIQLLPTGLGCAGQGLAEGIVLQLE